ncbi:BamA/TamA family outer membrane protein [Falsigemmobacter faecalis]|uniref:Bacterial surface antigen (D15) domain-containing protein n=1 Tax=Falsigemmobacter faecalis TaxID=2488730 RepID=A0A3P3DHZ9_9RHOB|nr:BamA/TamA family outer membrane protein [Falsigemmobacter faecalis]RRH73843.1 hypothetical protein EG244_12295 [Falsigemmobacter faecalis]
MIRTARQTLALAALAGLSSALPLAAQSPSGGAMLSAGAAWSSTRGAIGSIGLRGEDILKSGLDAEIDYRGGARGEEGRLRLRWRHDLGDTAFGRSTRGVITAQHSRSDWENDGYDTARTRLGFGISAELRPGAGYHFGLFWQENSLSNLRSATSPVVAAETGHSDAAGLEAALRLGRVDHATLPGVGHQLDLTVTAALTGERRFRAFEASALLARRLHPDWALSFRVSGGTTEGRAGQAVSLHDRAFVGGRSLRGFAAGGAGPRDYLAGVTDTALGGRNYLQSSLELRRDTRGPLSVGVFLDAGSAWGLDGRPSGAGGLIDDGFSLRSAAGVALYWKSPLGVINVNLARPLAARPSDSLSRVSLNLLSAF